MDLVWIVAFAALCACTGALVWACGALLKPAASSRH
jgi:hypothetical protein